MPRDALRACFDRFQKEVREEMEKKVSDNELLQTSSITTLNSEIASLSEEKKLQDTRMKENEERVCREQAAAAGEFRRQMRLQKQENEASMAGMAERAELLKDKERELLSLKTTVTQLRSSIAANKRNEILMTDAIDQYGVKINMVEMEIDNVRMRNRHVYEENKKLKASMGVRTREQEKEKAEIATFRPRMLDMADRMVAEYKKITKEIVKIDEKQKRIIAEKTAIIAQMQSAAMAAGAAKKRKGLSEIAGTADDCGGSSVTQETD